MKTLQFWAGAIYFAYAGAHGKSELAEMVNTVAGALLAAIATLKTFVAGNCVRHE